MPFADVDRELAGDLDYVWTMASDGIATLLSEPERANAAFRGEAPGEVVFTVAAQGVETTLTVPGRVRRWRWRW